MFLVLLGFFSASTFTWDAVAGGEGCVVVWALFSFSLCPEVGVAGKPPTLGLQGDAVEGEGPGWVRGGWEGAPRCGFGLGRAASCVA